MAATSDALDLPDGGLLAAIVRLNLVVTQVLEEIAGRSDLTFADYLVLGVVRRSSDGQSAPTTIATVLGRTTGGMSLTLNRLERAGLVRRMRHTDDGRRVIVGLTPVGLDVATEVNHRLHAWERDLVLPMSQHRAMQTIERLTAAVTTTSEWSDARPNATSPTLAGL